MTFHALLWSDLRRLVLPLLLLVLSACANPGMLKPSGYNGPTLTMEEVVARVNENNARLRTLWARHYFEATIVDEQHRAHFVNGDGALLYRQPRELRIVGNKDIAGTIFEIGSNDQTYWLKIVPEIDTLWWGHYRDLGKPRANSIPIRPDLVLQVLGLAIIPTRFDLPPVPTMRFNNDADAYMFVFNQPVGGHWVAEKEIWFDRATLLPKLVLLFDGNGRIIMRAYLAKHRRVEAPGLPESQWPLVATQFKMLFPQNGTQINFDLSDAVLQHKGLPSDRSFQMPDPVEAGVSKSVQIDQDRDEDQGSEGPLK